MKPSGTPYSVREAAGTPYSVREAAGTPYSVREAADTPYSVREAAGTPYSVREAAGTLSVLTLPTAGRGTQSPTMWSRRLLLPSDRSSRPGWSDKYIWRENTQYCAE